jgi:hypothetical protein
MVLVNEARSADSKNKGQSKSEEELSKRALNWARATKPEKVIGALQKLMSAIGVTRDTVLVSDPKSEVAKLAEQAAECVSLVATNILSLKHWHYLQKTEENDLTWFSAEWLKTEALTFALSYVRLAKKNEKFLNQLLSLAVFEFSALPRLSENLLSISMLYYTLY